MLSKRFRYGIALIAAALGGVTVGALAACYHYCRSAAHSGRWQFNRLIWPERQLGTVFPDRISSEISEALRDVGAEADQVALPTFVLLLYTMDGASTRVVAIRERKDCREVCAALQRAMRCAFPEEGGAMLSNYGELQIILSDGSCVAVWLNGLGFSTRADTVQWDLLFFSRELTQTLYRIAAREGEMEPVWKGMFRSQLDYAPVPAFTGIPKTTFNGSPTPGEPDEAW